GGCSDWQLVEESERAVGRQINSRTGSSGGYEVKIRSVRRVYVALVRVLESENLTFGNFVKELIFPVGIVLQMFSEGSDCVYGFFRYKLNGQEVCPRPKQSCRGVDSAQSVRTRIDRSQVVVGCYQPRLERRIAE